MIREPRFRKGKKDFKAGRNTTAAKRYQRAIEKYRRQKVFALKMAMATMTTAMSVARMRVIQTGRGMDKVGKSIVMAQEVINTALAIQKIFA